MSSHAYPLATCLEDALKPDAKAARTRGLAEEMVTEGYVVDALETDWLNVTEAEADAYYKLADSEAVAAQGHLQRYEDNQGNPVLAVTWWNLVPAKATRSKAAKEKPAAKAPPAEDHTDDLYFRAGRTKPRRKRYIDPRQMDLFRGARED